MPAWSDNSEQNVWALDAGLRVGFQATPIFEVFGQAGVGRDVFDLPSSVAADQDRCHRRPRSRPALRGAGTSVLEATASTGLALRRFDEASLGEVTTQLYNGKRHLHA